jgi:hypothetical protein
VENTCIDYGWACTNRVDGRVAMDDQQMGMIIAFFFVVVAIFIGVDVCMGVVWWVLGTVR